MRTPSPLAFLLTIAALVVAFPSLSSALSFESDFSDFESDWHLETGSDVTELADSITLRAADVSAKERGRILLRPILATTQSEILGLSFILEASDVTAPLAARVFYYDDGDILLGSDPLFGSLVGGTIAASGTVLNPAANVAGIRLRLYSNSQQGSVTLNRLMISDSIPAVPEPGTALLMGLGLAGLASGRSRQS